MLKRGYMTEKIGEPAMLEQLAEEASELAQAALKLARIIRKENPTPISAGTAMDRLLEEYTDVCICGFHLCLDPDKDIWESKELRFAERITGNGD